MTKNRNPLPEIELLSAYLDNQLTPHQRASLETRLRLQPALVAELEELRKTRQMLRALPRLRAPRNFTLSAQTIQKRSPARLPALFGAVSALSSAVLILLVIGGLLFGNVAKPASLAEESQAYPVSMEAPVAEEEALSVQSVAPEATEAAVSLAAPPSDDTSRNMLPIPEATATPGQEALSLGIAEESATPPTPTAMAYDGALPGVMLAEQGEEALPEGAAAKVPEATQTPEISPLTRVLFPGEIVLAGIALLSGLIALFLLIRQRR